MHTRKLVQDWMTPNPVTATPDTSLPQAHRTMEENKIRRLPIVKGDHLVGIITRGDIRGAQASEATSLSIWEINYLLAKLKIKEVMSRKVFTVTPETTIQAAAKMMLENKIAGLPVVSDGKLVGIITESDIFRVLVENWELERDPALA